MPSAAKTARAPSAQNLLIALDLIDAPLRPVRRNVDDAAHESLVSSVRALGVISPVLLAQRGERYALIAGERRVRAARAVGLTQIPAVVAMRDDELFAQAAASAENIVRLGMPPVDQWRAINAMRDLGYSLAEVAGSLGISERQVQRLSRLGNLHPDILALIEQIGLPATHELQKIAMADLTMQRNALLATGSVETDDDGKPTRAVWWRITQLCTVARIPRNRAVFDVVSSSIAFEEDLFAEPDSEWQWTTGDVAGFLAAQNAALAAKATRMKHKLLIVEEHNSAPKVPKGLRAVEASEGKRFAKKHEVQLSTIVTSGYRIGQVLTGWAIDVKAEQADMQAKARGAKTSAPTAGSDASDHIPDAGKVIDEPDTAAIQQDTATAAQDEPEATPIDQTGRRFTKTGLALIADMKTNALHRALRDDGNPPSIEQICAALVLTLFADNVQIDGYDSRDAAGAYTNERMHARDLRHRLFNATGGLTVNPDEIVAVACEAIARCIRISGPDSRRGSSGPNAEVIGKMLQADLHLGQFDTAAILSEASGDTLRAVAEMAKLPTKGQSVASLREAITGQVPQWLPHEAVFGPQTASGA